MINATFVLNPEHFGDVYGEECVAAVRRHARVLGQAPMSASDFVASSPEWLDQVDVLFTGWGAPLLDSALLARMPRLRAVFYAAGTLRFLVTDACWERDLVIVNAAAVNAIPTAEFATGTILLSLKRAWRLAAEVRTSRSFPKIQSVPGGYGATVGLVSLGLVGLSVARRLAGVDITILAYDPYAPAELGAELGIKRCSLEELFERSDVISLHAPLVPDTVGMVNARLLRLLKPEATFINTARGALVNEDDLIELLEARPDVQAILDVTDPEPPLPESRFYDLPNVFLTPHIAGSMGRECRRMGEAMVDEFARYLAGQPLLHAVSRNELARRA